VSKAIPSNSLEAAIRAHFGFTQAKLARYLGITRGQVAHIEAGRRLPGLAHTKRLWLLVELLPPPEGHGNMAPAPVEDVVLANVNTAFLASLPKFGPLPPRPLRVRQRAAGAQAAALRWEMYKETKRKTLQSRRQWGLAVLQAAVLQVADATERAHFERWVQTLAADVAATTPTPTATAAHALAVLRVMVLEAEVMAIDQLLNGA
jgi:transcriptional regulator with XRE-family HTH domain